MLQSNALHEDAFKIKLRQVQTLYRLLGRLAKVSQADETAGQTEVKLKLA